MELWTTQLDQLAPERRRAMSFLAGHLPASDLDCYPFSLFLRFADHALALRRQAPWCAALEEELFLHYVLFPRVNDEDLSFHRALFHDALWDRVSALPTQEARILEVNRWCHEEASYQLQDDRTASPLTVFRNGSGRCGEESTFLVSALRSVGIAARQVYAPRWAHCDDNHAWVEALCDGQWRFLGACEPEPILDRGWFNTAASRAIVVHSRLFGSGTSPLHGAPLGRTGAVSWYNQTPRYAPTCTYTFQVLRSGLPAAGAGIHIQVLNEASFHTVATLTADEQGQARAELGLGQFHVLARLDGLTAERDCCGPSLTLELERPGQGDTAWRDLDMTAPKDAPLHPALLTSAQKEERAAVLSAGQTRRAQKLTALDCSGQVPESCRPLVRAARSNGPVIAAFLAEDPDGRREALVCSLTRKDLRDVTEEVLFDHLEHTPPAHRLPPEVYAPWVLCPRIELEPLTPWRQALGQAFTPAEQAAYRAQPAALWDELCRRMDTDLSRIYTGQNTGLVWTPLAAWRSGRCDRRSLRILYVALLRTLGVPARLRTLDGMPEFWQDGGFCPLHPQGEGRLCLRHPDPQAPLYQKNWTLSLWKDGTWQLLRLTDGGWQGGQRIIPLPAGRYRLITSVRMPNGNQFASSRVLTVRAGETAVSDLRLRPYLLEDLLGCQDMPPMSARTTGGEEVPDLWRIDGRPSLLFWLEEGSEPTEHVLHELADAGDALRALPVNLIFLIRSPKSLAHPALDTLCWSWPELRVLLDDWDFDLETAARHLGCDPDRPPLAVACNGRGQAVYGVSGYHVGSVELLTRIAAHLTGRA